MLKFPEKINVIVSDKNLREGVRVDGNFCPVALAVKRKFPLSHVLVISTSVIIDGVKYPTPRWVAEKIRAFDRGEDVVPFRFTSYVSPGMRCVTL